MNQPYTLSQIFRTGLCLLAFVWLAGCSGTPSKPGPASRSAPAAQSAEARQSLETARAMLGKPYRFGGASPRGFDCSGLVYYAFNRAGIAVPRTTTAQFRHSDPVTPAKARPGDLVFFKLTARRVSHVGIYLGDGRFIHAPSRGKRVSYASLSDTYWQQRMVGFRRFD